ncbi:MAG: GMC family oxidoreductase [Gammaproteobacteria bacterium]|nr:GMC family oxidoreductase [Gammaproteobacteria bacterium]
MTNTDAMPEETEIVIVGAGPAGCLCAATLAAAGKDVVVIEAGPAWQLTDLVSSQIWSRRLKWGGPLTQQGGKDPLGTGFTGGWGFGGAALHHYAGWPRILPDELRTYSLHAQGADWPLRYEDLRPYYDRIQDEVGLCGDVQQEAGRPDRRPYAMPPLPVFPQARQLARGFERMQRRVRPGSAAINTIAYGGRPACLWDGWCDAGCPTGALANPLVTYLPRARTAGASFHADSSVRRVLSDRDGRATGIEYVAANEQPGSLRAQVVILAGGAIQNARLLLNSATTVHPHGLGNSSRLVGRYFGYHVIANLYGLFEDDLQNHLGTSLPPLYGDSVSPGNRPDGPYGNYTWGLGPALKPNDLLGIAVTRPDLFGAALHKFLQSAARHLGTMSAVAETVFERDNRVELSDQRDRFGVPLARLVNTFSANSLALWKLAITDGHALMQAAGAREIWHSPMVAAHQLGGTRMGEDPAQSVTDSYGKLHDVANVLVAGGGLFPGCGASGPTFTIHALALRSAEHLLQNWSRLTNAQSSG